MLPVSHKYDDHLDVWNAECIFMKRLPWWLIAHFIPEVEWGFIVCIILRMCVGWVSILNFFFTNRQNSYIVLYNVLYSNYNCQSTKGSSSQYCFVSLLSNLKSWVNTSHLIFCPCISLQTKHHDAPLFFPMSSVNCISYPIWCDTMYTQRCYILPEFRTTLWKVNYT